MARLITALLALALLLTARNSFAIFPDARDSPPANWTGPIFRLSQNYPAVPPSEPLPWKNYDFKTQPVEYAKAVLSYAYEGNIEVEWDGARNAVRKWYHAPWMHYGRQGREFVHGLTPERVSEPQELHSSQQSRVQNWAIGLYNPIGGHVIGLVWENENVPDGSRAVFPDGTVAIKLLFTQATSRQVPYLKNSLQWDANIQKQPRSNERHVRKLRLLQIDFAVRESRADDTTGWVFGTFVYDADAPGRSAWERMLPLGLMWGNDPGVTPEHVASGTALKEGILNTALPDSHPKHLGWAGRLNGPVDNPTSSCLSCHATAQLPRIDQHPKPEDETSEKLRYFRNIQAGQPFEQGGHALDYSLQLTRGILSIHAAQSRMLRGLRSHENVDTPITRD